MDIKKRILDLEYRYNLGMQQEELDYVVAHIDSNISGSEDTWKMAVEALMAFHRHDILAQDAKSQKEFAHKKCPVCGTTGLEITLMSERPAYYCPTHRVVIPKAKDAAV